MAGKEYYALVKGSISNKKHHAIESNAVRHFGTFYAERCADGGGTFQVDPKWGEQLYNPGARTLPVVVKQKQLTLATPSGYKKADDSELA
jgi:hypothetical protein